MKHFLHRSIAVSLLVLTVLLSACSTTNVATVTTRSAKTPGEPIQRMAVYFQRASFQEGDAHEVERANSYSRMLFPILEQRIKPIFLENGIQIPTMRIELEIKPNASLLASAFDCCGYVLRIREEKYRYNSSVHHLVLAAELYSRKAGLLWSAGVATNGRIDTPELMGQVADEALKKILETMREDRVLDVATIRMPAPEAFTLPHIADASAVPGLGPDGTAGYRSFVTSTSPRAFALGPFGTWGAASASDQVKPGDPQDIQERALARCQKSSKVKCRIYALGQEVIWRGF